MTIYVLCKENKIYDILTGKIVMHYVKNFVGLHVIEYTINWIILLFSRKYRCYYA
jgi:hypothetical protein